MPEMSWQSLPLHPDTQNHHQFFSSAPSSILDNKISLFVRSGSALVWLLISLNHYFLQNPFSSNIRIRIYDQSWCFQSVSALQIKRFQAYFLRNGYFYNNCADRNIIIRISTAKKIMVETTTVVVDNKILKRRKISAAIQKITLTSESEFTTNISIPPKILVLSNFKTSFRIISPHQKHHLAIFSCICCEHFPSLSSSTEKYLGFIWEAQTFCPSFPFSFHLAL